MEDAKNKDEQNVTKAEAEVMRVNRLVQTIKMVRLNH